MVKYKLKEELQARSYKKIKELESEFDENYQEFLEIALKILKDSEHIKETSDKGNKQYTFSYSSKFRVKYGDRDKLVEKFNQSDITDLELKKDGSYNNYKFCW
jgi:hypothetical protein